MNRIKQLNLKGDCPGILHFEDIKGLNCTLTVKCLDCGTVFMRNANHWLVQRNQSCCDNCYRRRAVAMKVKALEEQGFEVLSTEKTRHGQRIYTVRCPNCGLVFDQWGCNLKRWIKNGAKCPGCLGGGKLPPDAVRIRKACIEAGITYLELGEEVNYSDGRVGCIANGFNYNEETAKYIADVAEKIAKDKR